jgi:DnaJ-domain-containing protein 1
MILLLLTALHYAAVASVGNIQFTTYQSVSAQSGSSLYMYAADNPQEGDAVILSEFPWLAWRIGAIIAKSVILKTVDGKPHRLGPKGDSTSGGNWSIFDGDLERLAKLHANLPVCSESDGKCWEQQQKTKIDPYKVLGVSRFGTQEDIKRAYRALSLLHHPDKASLSSANSVDNANSADALTFEEIGLANGLIGDAAKRVSFDTSERMEKGYYFLVSGKG